jgi:hypothetical protein
VANQLICDLCKRPCNEITAKLYYAPRRTERRRKGFSYHSDYTHHLDVGECCSDRVLTLFNWRPRKTKKEASGRRQRV